VSKTPAKKTTPTKPAARKPAEVAKKPAVAAKKPAAVPSKAAAVKQASAPAKALPPPKPPAKTPRPAPPVPAKAPAKPPAKTSPPGKAAATTPKPAPAPAKPAVPVPSAPAAVKVPVTPTKPAAPVAPKPATRRASKYASMEQVQAPLPPPTSRFADRFAPPRPPTRQMNNLGLDVLKPAHKADPKLANAWKSKAGRDLTEPEVLAMPEAEYMNDKQLDFFRFKLQTLKDDLLSNAGETTEHLREDTSIVPDPADRATIEEEHALELRTRDRERKLLKKISQSLGRIEAGDYGFCDETGEPIGLGRLIARPTATLSLEAQQRRELKQKMFGD
jgi:DnaK suppressor protein